MNSSFFFVNDTFLPATQASLLVTDLSIQRAYGIFDFFMTLGDRPIFLDEHLDRFFHSAAQLRLPVGRTREELKTIIAGLQQRNGIPDSGIRMTLTGGYSADGYTLSQPNLIITQKPLDTEIIPICEPPIRLVTYPHCRQMPGTKTIDYLMAIWLQPYIRQHDANDVLYHQNGVVSECPRSNFFIVTADDSIVTPARNILLGITRMKVLEVAATRFRVEERDVTLEDIRTAKEAFITSTTKHILPVSHIDGHQIGQSASTAAAGVPAVGASAPGVPGPVSQWLNEQVYELVVSHQSKSPELPIFASNHPHSSYMTLSTVLPDITAYSSQPPQLTDK
jgi:D-alanine transaminase/branched-chain amino acid aminotransferase